MSIPNLEPPTMIAATVAYFAIALPLASLLGKLLKRIEP
jgi:hypothetical protein